MTKSAKINNSNALLFDFWGLKQLTEPDPTIRVWTDPNVLKLTKAKRSSSDDLELGEFGSKVSRMGFAKIQQKEERMMRLRKLIDDGRVKTVQEALHKMEDIKTEKTITDYLLVIGRELLDETTGKIKGSPIADFSGTMPRKKSRKFALNYKYYTADPTLGGTEISHDEYQLVRKSLLNLEDDD